MMTPHILFNAEVKSTGDPSAAIHAIRERFGLEQRQAEEVMLQVDGMATTLNNHRRSDCDGIPTAASRTSSAIQRIATAGLLAAGLVLVLAGIVFPWPVDRGFKDANLEGASTEAEVYAILGPSGDYSTPIRTYGGTFCGTGRVFNHNQKLLCREVVWKDDYAVVVVYFGKRGQKPFVEGVMVSRRD